MPQVHKHINQCVHQTKVEPNLTPSLIASIHLLYCFPFESRRGLEPIHPVIGHHRQVDSPSQELQTLQADWGL